MKVLRIMLLLLVASFAAEIEAQDKRAKADIQTVRLAPNRFSQLPKAVVRDLEKRSCLIPQSYLWNKRHNVLRGEFKRQGQKDWAVLCSKNRKSSVLIYWNGSSRGVSKIASTEDKDFLQTIGDGKIGFSRIIGIANAKYINDHYESYGGPRPPKISHNGINDIFAEKASEVLYLHRGKWLKLQGAD